MTPTPGLSEPVTAQPSIRGIGQIWASFKARPRSYKIRLSLVLLCTVAAIVVAMPLHTSPTRRVASDDNPMPVKLEDGSRILLLPHSELNLDSQRADDLAVKLVGGSARFQIVRNSTRRFRVVAADLEAVTTGATLTVRSHNDGSHRFSVDQGEVELRRLPETALLAQLHAGESWPATGPSPSETGNAQAKPLPDRAGPQAPGAGAEARVPVGADR